MSHTTALHPIEFLHHVELLHTRGPPLKDLLQGIWFVHSSGMCLVSRQYGSKEPLDESLFTGFLTAFQMFTQEVVRENIEQLITASCEFHYKIYEQFIVVLKIQRKIVQKKYFSWLLTQMGDDFERHYEHQLIRSNGVVETKLFWPYLTKIDEIVQMQEFFDEFHYGRRELQLSGK